MVDQLSWGSAEFELGFAWGADAPVRVVRLSRAGADLAVHAVPLVEILTAGHGHLPSSDRLAHTELGSKLRYIDHEVRVLDGRRTLTLRQGTGDVEATVTLEILDGAPSAVRSAIEVRATGPRPLVLRSVPSLTLGFTQSSGADPEETDHFAGWDRVWGTGDWLGEGRWTREPLRGPDFPRLASHLTSQNPRGSWSRTSDGTWSTGRHLPVGAVVFNAIASSAAVAESAVAEGPVSEEAASDAFALAWQIEHNGPWRWELGEDIAGGYLSLSGPTDADAAWTRVLRPGETFTTVPATIAAGAGFEGALAALTDFRRAARRPHPDNAAMPVVFNDYMNTLDGDPTTEKLLPLVAAAAESGAEVFCIDAGWYDDSGDWWPTVGEWRPSTTRFPGGLGEVIEAIRAAGMVPGLWLEPEVIGVHSPVADTLPDEAFLLRHGQRVVEHHRYHLDLRHPAAVSHLDGVVDRLIEDFGVGFFKFDYNVDPGPGTDRDADSVGDGLLGHNRAHLAWIDRLLDRHPGLVIENCSSGAMRMDFAMLSRLAMQSTSDQQDFTKFPPIAAAAPVAILPEQAANWAYPQPGMTPEEVAFCLVTGLLGRFYVSGHLNRMSEGQRAMVAEAVRAAKTLRGAVAGGRAHWPTGLPGWDDPWTSLALEGDGEAHVSLWRRGGPSTVELRFPHLAGSAVTAATVFPRGLPEWKTEWDAGAGTLTVQADSADLAARTLRLAIDSPIQK